MPGPTDNLSIVKNWYADVLLVLAFLTRLPVPVPATAAGRPLSAAAWAFPVAGLLVGGLAALVLLSGHQLGLPPLISALLAVAASARVCGALHEDGLADVADGFGGGRAVEDKLRIMRDSRIGSYGVLALVFSVSLRAAALAALASPVMAVLALLAAAAISRGVVVAVMNRLDQARTDGLAAGAGRPSGEQAMVALAIAAATGFVLLGAGGWLALGVALAAAAVLSALANRQVGGQTGDVLGAVQQVSEIAVLLSVAALG